jgi:undecaprenyl-diphosphatase
MGGTFEIFIQLGAVVAVLAFYARTIFEQVLAVRTDTGVRRFWLGIVIAFIPAALIGVLFSDFIKAVLFDPVVVAISLIVGGIIFLLVERHLQNAPVPRTASLTSVSLRQALVIGLTQLSALIPGVSRSGASIIGGMLAGLNRQTATQFSFFLAIPTLGGATVYDLWRSRDLITNEGLLLLVIGTVVAGIVAWLSIAWLLRFVARNTFVAFGYYRIIAGIIIIALVLAQLIPSDIL